MGPGPLKRPEVKKATGMILSGVFSAETIDSSGERVLIEGVDCSSFDTPESIFCNYEHVSPEDGKTGQELVGKVIYLKKIFKESDCEDDDQLSFFKKNNKIPYLYGMFSQMFGENSPFGAHFGFNQRAPQKNRDLRIELWLTLEETLTEQKKSVSIKGMTGKPIAVEVDVPRGLDDGAQIRYSGLGDNSDPNLPNGDLYVVYRIHQHKTFVADQGDLHYIKVISCFDAILGTELKLTTLDGKEISVNVPAGTQPRTQFRLREQGLYSIHRPGRGNLIITINIEIPKISDITILNSIRELKKSII